jgi:HlyD family secretion protein
MNKKIVIGISLIVTLLVVIIVFKSCKKETRQISFETFKVKKGNVSNSITATGTVQATKTVSVGTQVSGVIDKIYVDFNSHVKSGDLLAELDKRTLKTNLDNSQANLENAQAELTFQTANYNRIKALADKSLVAQNDYDQAIYNYTKAQAGFKTAQLDYNRAKINLNYASIYSPIDGVILDRAVDEGQTVAASFSTPTLFSIANDLTQMQVEASIDEADIGKVKDGQRVSFTVDAYSDLQFEGKVVQIRFQPVIKSNVVTYTVIVKAPNPNMKLMPGMTASITVYVEEASNVLVLSSKALHFVPDQELIAKNKTGKDQKNRPGISQTPQMKMDSMSQTVWVKKGNDIFPVPVKIGIDDDINAQVIKGLKEGDEVVIAMNASTGTAAFKGSAQSSSPFMPRPPARSSGSRPQ